MDNNATPELLTALNKAMAAMTMAAKSGNNTFDKYRYGTLEDYLDATRKPCLDNGLLLVCQLVGSPEFSERTTKNGNSETVCRILVEAAVYHASSGGRLAVTAWGEGQDRSDKAIYKAITGGRKYAIAMLFGIYTSDDPEKDSPAGGKERKAQKPSVRQTILAAIAKESNNERLTNYTKRIDELAASGELNDADAKECRKRVAAKVTELASADSAAAPPTELFNTTPEPEGVGV